MRRSLTLAVGADATIDLKLTVASLQESVTVSGEAPAIEVGREAACGIAARLRR